MLALAYDRAGPLLRGWLDSGEPRLFTAWHVAMTGNGACLVDSWPEPRAALAVTLSNYALLGAPEAFSPEDLRHRVVGFLEAPEASDALVQRAFVTAVAWPRVAL